MGSVHWYLFERLVVATALPGPTASVLGFLLAGLVLSIPLSFIASRRLDKNVARYFVVPVYVWLGFAFQAFFLVLAIDIVRVVAKTLMRLVGIPPVWAPGAEALLAWRVVAGGAVLTVLLATGFAIVWGLTQLVVRRIEIPLGRLPAEMDGFTILHLTDIHLDLESRWVRKLEMVLSGPGTTRAVWDAQRGVLLSATSHGTATGTVTIAGMDITLPVTAESWTSIVLGNQGG